MLGTHPLRGRPEQVRAGLDGLRSLPQLAGRDRRAIAQATPAPSQPPAPHGSAVPLWGHRSYPVTEIQSVEATTSLVRGPTLATRATVEVGAWEGAGRVKRPRSKASIMAAECGSERRRSRACPGEGRGRAERSEASREAGALTAEHAAARSRQIDHSHPGSLLR